MAVWGEISLDQQRKGLGDQLVQPPYFKDRKKTTTTKTRPKMKRGLVEATGPCDRPGACAWALSPGPALHTRSAWHRDGQGLEFSLFLPSPHFSSICPAHCYKSISHQHRLRKHFSLLSYFILQWLNLSIQE